MKTSALKAPLYSFSNFESTYSQPVQFINPFKTFSPYSRHENILFDDKVNTKAKVYFFWRLISIHDRCTFYETYDYYFLLLYSLSGI